MTNSMQEIIDKNADLQEQCEKLIKEVDDLKMQASKYMSEAYRYKSAFDILVDKISNKNTTF